VQSWHLKGICGLVMPCPSRQFCGIALQDAPAGSILSYSGVALIALWLLDQRPMAIERSISATALPSMARSVLRCSLGPRSRQSYDQKWLLVI